MDPIADKVFIAVCFLPAIDMGWLPAWMVGGLFVREFAVTAARSVCERRGVSLKSPYLARYKTWAQMCGIGVLFLLGAAPDWVMDYVFMALADLPGAVLRAALGAGEEDVEGGGLFWRLAHRLLDFPPPVRQRLDRGDAGLVHPRRHLGQRFRLHRSGDPAPRTRLERQRLCAADHLDRAADGHDRAVRDRPRAVVGADRAVVVGDGARWAGQPARAQSRRGERRPAGACGLGSGVRVARRRAGTAVAGLAAHHRRARRRHRRAGRRLRAKAPLLSAGQRGQGRRRCHLQPGTSPEFSASRSAQVAAKKKPSSSVAECGSTPHPRGTSRVDNNNALC